MKKECEKLVSIVVPVYNVEKYLKRCIDSLKNQTYNNIEILLVNDGSTDASLSICEKEAIGDNRIKVISQKNGGLSDARNTGINNATGEYICFVDSDDFVNEHYIQLLFENLLETNSDISVCNYMYIDENDKTWIREEKNKQEYSNIEAIKDVLSTNQDTEVMAWNKLYKKELFTKNNIYFPKGKIHEDNFTTYKLFYYAKKVSLINDKLYYYYQRTDSIMGQKFNTKRLHILEAVEETKKFFEDKEVELSQELEYYELITLINTFNFMIRDNFVGKEKYDIIKKVITNKSKYKKNVYITKREKIFLSTIGKKGDLYKIILKIFDKFIRK